jgi:hypothetical protein
MNKHYFSYVFAFLALLFAGNSIAEQALTQDSITKVLESIQTAALKHDAEGVISHFSPSAEIEVEVMGFKTTLSVSEYKGMLVQGWAASANYTIEVRDVIISIDPDGKTAKVTDVVIETLELYGQTISVKTYETAMFASTKKGVPIITHFSARAEM